MTNILALPLVKLIVETGNNEDWIDSIKFVVDNGTEDPPQLDLTGIAFEMEVRRKATDHEVLIGASTANGRLMIGASPDVGFLVIKVPLDEMKALRAGPYIADIRAEADDRTRVCIQIDPLTIIEGVTKSP